MVGVVSPWHGVCRRYCDEKVWRTEWYKWWVVADMVIWLVSHIYLVYLVRIKIRRKEQLKTDIAADERDPVECGSRFGPLHRVLFAPNACFCALRDYASPLASS
jgi:hypothetical protein